MAIGIGIGDCALILESLVRCASLLRGEAVDGFAGHAEAYRSFANATAYLRRYLKAEGHTIKPVLRFELKSLKKLLKLFISRIQKLEPSLGSNRQRRGFRRIWQKIRWPFHDAILNGICHKLNSKFSMIKFIIDLETAQTIRIVNPCPPAGLSSAPAVGPKFVLMDARSKLHGVSMAGVKSWTDLATFIRNVFCAGNQSCLAVERRSYLLRNKTTEMTFFPNSPSVPPWEDAIKEGDEIEMSMLFPNRTVYNDLCPKCKNPWSSPISVEMFCLMCGLSARFLDSFDDEPDPVTSIALRDVRGTNVRMFFEKAMSGLGANKPNKMKNQEALFEQKMKALIRQNRREVGPHPQMAGHHDRSEIQDFRRITLCNEQWPDFAKRGGLADSSTKRLRTIVQGLKRRAEILKGEDFLPAVLASIIKSRFANGRRNSGMTTFLQSIIDAHTDRQTLWTISGSSLPSLQEYIWHVRDAGAQFHVSVIRFRCLLWIYSEALELNTDLVRGCCDLFDYWAVPEGTAPREPMPLLFRLAGPMWLPHVIIWRLTFDMVEDFASFFTEGDPMQILACLFLLVRDTSKLAIGHCFDGNLTVYLREALASRDNAVCHLNQASRKWMESALQFRGQALVDKSTFMMINTTMS